MLGIVHSVSFTISSKLKKSGAMDKASHHTHLSVAIDKADPTVLRSMLKDLCKRSDKIRQHTKGTLLVAPTSKKRKATDEESGSAKRTALTSRYEKCVVCETTFDVTKNHRKACQMHPGKAIAS